MDCTCHVPRKESSLTSGIVFSAGLKQEAPAPPVSWCVALLAGSAVRCDSQSGNVCDVFGLRCVVNEGG